MSSCLGCSFVGGRQDALYRELRHAVADLPPVCAASLGDKGQR